MLCFERKENLLYVDIVQVLFVKFMCCFCCDEASIQAKQRRTAQNHQRHHDDIVVFLCSSEKLDPGISVTPFKMKTRVLKRYYTPRRCSQPFSAKMINKKVKYS